MTERTFWVARVIMARIFAVGSQRSGASPKRPLEKLRWLWVIARGHPNLEQPPRRLSSVRWWREAWKDAGILGG